MNYLSLLISAAVAFLLTSYIFLFEWSSESQKIQHSKYILNFDPEKVVDFELKYKDNSSLKITRKKLIWKISLPIDCKADQLTINSIMLKLHKLPKFNSVSKKDQQKDLAAYGLKNPALTLKITYQNSEQNKVESRTLLFGNLTANKGEVFVKADNNSTIYLLHSAVLKVLNQNWNNYRFKRLIDMNRESINRINFKNPDGSWSIFKNNFTWYCDKPFAWKCDQEEINNFIEKLYHLQVTGYAENDLSKKSKYGLDTPKQSVQFIDKNKNSYTLFLGLSRAGTTFIQNTSENFIVGANTDQLDEIFPNLKSARTLTFMASKSHEITGIQYKNKNGNIIFQKDISQQWSIANKKFSLDQNSITNLVERTSIILPEYFIDKIKPGETFGFDENAQVITVRNLKGFTEKITIGRKTNGWAIPSHLEYFTTQDEAVDYAIKNKVARKSLIPVKNSYYAKYGEYDQVFIIDQDIVSLFQRPLIYFTKKTIGMGIGRNANDNGINNIRTIKRFHGGKEEVFTKLNNLTWIQTNDNNKKLKYQKLALLLLSLSEFTVDEWISPSVKEENLKDYGLDKPLASIEATYITFIDEVKDGKPKKKRITAQFKFSFSKKTIRGNHYGHFLQRKSSKEKFKHMGFIFTISPRRLNGRLLANFH